MKTLARTVRPYLLVAALCALLAACAPAAAPTNTPVPATSAPTDAPEPTDVPPAETDAADAGAETAEANETDDASVDATVEADETSTEAAEAGGAGEVMGTVTVSTTRLRAAPSSSADVVGELTQGARLVILGASPDNGYYFARTDDGAEGWTARQSITLDNLLEPIPRMTPPAS